MRFSILMALVVLAAFVGCGRTQVGHPEQAAVQIALPAPLTEGNAYEIAGAQPLPERESEDYDDVHRIYHLSEKVISGSEPHGESALRRLAAMGVKTIVCVDGKVPNVEAAAALGMRYVHQPILYSGISDEETLNLAKTFRELEAPFYVHCFHGRHRGPAAAALGRLVADGAPREQALAEMRQWCGTAEKYQGLYEYIGKHQLPTAEESAAHAWDFPSSQKAEGVRQGMVTLPRAFDSLTILKKNEWRPDASHPDLDALNEAQKMHEAYAQMNALKEVTNAADDFQGWMMRSEAAAEDLVSALERLHAGDSSALDVANRSYLAIKQDCNACHKVYRNTK